MSRAIKGAAWHALIGILATGGCALWDARRSPGDPSAPTQANFDALVAAYLETEDGRRSLDHPCLPLPLAYRFEERGHPGVFFNYSPPGFRIAIREPIPEARRLQVDQFSALAKVGYFREETETLPDGGTARVFLMDWKIRDAAPWGDGANCLQAPKREFLGVKEWNNYTERVTAARAGKGEAPFVPTYNAMNGLEASSAAEGGLTVYQVWFEAGVAKLTPELEQLLATGLFEAWRPLAVAEYDKLPLVR